VPVSLLENFKYHWIFHISHFWFHFKVQFSNGTSAFREKIDWLLMKFESFIPNRVLSFAPFKSVKVSQHFRGNSHFTSFSMWFWISMKNSIFKMLFLLKSQGQNSLDSLDQRDVALFPRSLCFDRWNFTLFRTYIWNISRL